MAAWVRGLLGTLALLALAQVAGVSEGMNRWLTDAHWRWRASARRAPFPPEIVVVAIDDVTLQKKGRLGDWSRAEYAVLLDHLQQASAVGLDVLFTEKVRDPAQADGDTALVEAVRRHGRVVVPWHTSSRLAAFGETEEAKRWVLGRMPRASAEAGEQIPPTYAHRIEPPFDPLRSAAAALGSADVDADPDGVYRSPVLLYRTPDGVLLPHFTLALAATARGTTLADALRGVPQVQLGRRTVSLSEGRLWLGPLARPEGSAREDPGEEPPTVSFVEALQSPPKRFAGKVVLVGETATGTTDIRPNPLSAGLRGVELNAEILANLLDAPPVGPLSLALQWPLILFGAGVPLALYSLFTPGRATLLAAVTLLVLVGALEAAFWSGRVPSWSPVLIAVFGSTLFMGLQRLAEEEAQKRVLRTSFSRYVAPELVEQIVSDPESARLEGERRRVAVLFSDIRAFTTFSEQNPPEQVVRQMREYLNEMTEAVQSNHGVLDKFIGDAVMALYGPFLAGEVNLSAIAVASALDMLRRLERLNNEWLAEGFPPFRIGIGIHVGEAVVGNIGVEQREQYTALGDTVNLASRLQTATKDLHAVLLISEDVEREAGPLLGDVAELVDRGSIAVKGREQEVRVFEVRPKMLVEEAADVP